MGYIKGSGDISITQNIDCKGVIGRSVVKKYSRDVFVFVNGLSSDGVGFLVTWLNSLAFFTFLDVSVSAAVRLTSWEFSN